MDRFDLLIRKVEAVNILVIDIGTSSMRGIVFDEKGEKLSTSRVKYEPLKYPDGRIEQSPQDWTDALISICRDTAPAPGSNNRAVDAVAVTAQRSSVIPLDDKGKPLMDAIMWQDSRNAGICEELEPYRDLIFRKSGAALNTVFSGSKMTWIKRSCPEFSDRICKFVNIPEYLIHEMTGEYVTDVTYGSRSHLMDLRKRCWDPELLDLFEVREDQLCTLKEPGSVVGTVTAAFAAKSRLPEGIPVISSGGDQQCAAVGQGAFREGTLSLVAGTGGYLAAAVDTVPENLSARMICNCSSVSGRYMLETNVLTCSSALDWYCKNFYFPDQGKIDYRRIDRDLEKLDGKVSSALVLPYFQGRSAPEWNPKARAVFADVSLSTGRDELLKALLEGICMELQNSILEFGGDAGITEACISGGLTASPAIDQILADVCGITLHHTKDSESTAFGALITAAVGQGVYPDFDSAFEAVCGDAVTDDFKPRAELHTVYEQKRAKMNQLYKRIYD